MGRVKISQCMIVKNEEKNIEQALTWAREIVSEQIVVDTGSSDRTAEIARRMGAKVYEFTWVDDFAAAKNYAISKASCEWIAFLDADEYMTKEDAGKVMSCIEKIHNSQYDGIMTAWVHMADEDQILGVETQIRIFRNIPALRYRRRVHEYLTFSGNLRDKNADMAGEISIFHTGYIKKERQEKKKSERNIKLIEAELKENPYDFEMWGYLGNEYDNADEWEAAEETYRKSISLMPEHLDEFDVNASMTYLRLLNLLIRRPGSEEAAVMEVYREAVKRRPMEADYDYLAGQYQASIGNYPAGEKHLRRALEILEQHRNTGKSMLLSAKILKAYELLAICCFNNGNLTGCVQIATALLKQDPYLMSTAVVMLSAFREDDKDGSKAGDVAAFLGRSFYDYSALKNRMFVLRAAMSAGYKALEQIMRGTFTQEELEAVNQALGASISKEGK
ncbi:MAG: glycosyltransferase family 2 protein [Hungatella sp.]|nr:glycosyltransferase family 2 protein [Hungatella sp.]